MKKTKSEEIMENQETINTPPPLPVETKPKPRNLPTFVKGWVITDLIICCFNFIFVLVAICAFLHVTLNSPLNIVPAQIFFLIIIIPGIVADILILCKKASGIKFANVSIFITGCSIIIIILGIITNLYLTALPEKSIMVKFSLILLIKCTLLWFYWKAILRAKVFFAECGKTKEPSILKD